LFASGPANAILKPHHLLPDLNQDWFYLSGTGLPRFSWKRGHQTGVVVVVVVVVNKLSRNQKHLKTEVDDDSAAKMLHTNHSQIDILTTNPESVTTAEDFCFS